MRHGTLQLYTITSFAKKNPFKNHVLQIKELKVKKIIK